MKIKWNFDQSVLAPCKYYDYKMELYMQFNVSLSEYDLIWSAPVIHWLIVLEIVIGTVYRLDI